MNEASDSQRLVDYVLDLLGEDPFAHVYRASHEHREAHGPECGVHPSSPLSMRLVSLLVAGSGAKRILEIGCGLGYSALWMAEAAGPDGRVDTIDRFPEHLRLAEQYFAAAGFAERVRFFEGEADDVLPRLHGPYDFVYDDGWFIHEPAYLETMLGLLRPRGVLAIANWFPLEEAVLGGSEMDWADRIQAYARKLARHPNLRLTYTLQPWLGLAVKVS